MPKLSIELVPQTSWWTNVRSMVSRKTWDIIRRQTYAEANYCCEICGGKGTKHPVECHEIWHYDDKKGIQKLLKMIALCPKCHEVKHIGLSSIRGRLKEATTHLAKINGWNEQEANVYIDDAFKIWHGRNCIKWKIDISFLKEFGVDINAE